MNVDTELETWRREWRGNEEPFPALKRKIRRQNLRIAAAIAAIALCMIFAAIGALRTHSSFMAGLLCGLAFASVLQGSYASWARRGSWRPAAQTTLAYAELSHKRALALVRTTRFAFYFILVATILYAGFVAWNWRHFSMTFGLIVVAMTIEIFILGDNRRRAHKGVEETRELLEQTKQMSEPESGER